MIYTQVKHPYDLVVGKIYEKNGEVILITERTDKTLQYISGNKTYSINLTPEYIQAYLEQLGSNNPQEIFYKLEKQPD